MKINFSMIAALLVCIGVGTAAHAQTEASSKLPVKVFILAGQSNMEGKARVALLKHQMMQPETKEIFAHLHKDGELIERDDVFIKFLDRKGKLTAGFGSKDKIGPELQFGFTVGDQYEQPVLLIKTAWGGKSLYRDFRSPSGGKADAATLEKQLEKARKRKPETKMEDIEQSYGFYYRAMMKDVKESLADIDSYVPGYQGQGYEIAGFAWFQGFNDMVNADFIPAYTDLMAHFIRDVRRDLDEPNLPFVIGVLGVGGKNEAKKNEKKEQFKRNQAAVGDLTEFKGNVAIVHTDQYWDMEADAVFKKGWKENLEEWNTVGSDRPYHYLGSVKCYNRIGGALAEALIGLQDKKSATNKSSDAKIKTGDNFKKKNLVAWCIVPFDAKNRGPAERAKMVRDLGLRRVAYDWRKNHIPEFETEILEYKKNDIEYFAFWNWEESMEPLIRKHGIKPQIWDMYRGQLQGTEEEKIEQMVDQFSARAKTAKSLGLKFGIYNHGGFAGQPENMIAACKLLRQKHGLDNVGIVYNFHHGHEHIESFASSINMLKPYLLCVNLNGMADPESVDQKTKANKIMPIGSGSHESKMIKALVETGYDGPIGVLGHRKEMDAKEAVQLNLDGLDSMIRISGK
ncbi:MAG: sialate O-acetylesterase [Planctomycetota bacterium]